MLSSERCMLASQNHYSIKEFVMSMMWKQFLQLDMVVTFIWKVLQRNPVYAMIALHPSLI